LIYNALFHSGFKKDIKKLSSNIKDELKELIQEIKENPNDAEPLSDSLAGIFRRKYVIGNVDYRLSYTIENDNIIFLMFKTRENYYKYLERRIK